MKSITTLVERDQTPESISSGQQANEVTVEGSKRSAGNQDAFTAKPNTQTAMQSPIEGHPKRFLETLGYKITADQYIPGFWNWTTDTDGCDLPLPSAVEALESAWQDAMEQTLALCSISCESWEAMSFSEQQIAIKAGVSRKSRVMQTA